MLVEVRIYRRHDADLIMLKSYGVSISRMMRLALENYVAGQRIKLCLPDSHACDISDCSMLRYRLNIQNPEVIKLLKSIKHGYRNQFCKALLRDMLDCGSLGVYLGTDEAVEFENKRIKTESLVAGDELGLISKRAQIGNASFKKREKVQKEKISKVLDNVKKEEQAEEERKKKIIEDIFNKPEKEPGTPAKESPVMQAKAKADTLDERPEESAFSFGSDDINEASETGQQVNEEARSGRIFSMFDDLL
jgi:hypothetical protein